MRSVLHLFLASSSLLLLAPEAQADPELWYHGDRQLVHVDLADDGSEAAFTASNATVSASGEAMPGGFAGVTLDPDGGLLLSFDTSPTQLYYLSDPPRDGSDAYPQFLGDMGTGAYGGLVLEGLYIDCAGRAYGMDTGEDTGSNVGNRLLRFTGEVSEGDLSYEIVADLDGAVASDIDDMGPGIDADGFVVDNPGFAIDSGAVYELDYQDGSGSQLFSAGTWGIHAIDGAEFSDGRSRLYVLTRGGALYEIDPDTGAQLRDLGHGPAPGRSGLGGTLASDCDTGFDPADADEDGIPDADDACPDTTFDAPERGLGNSRWGDVDGDGVFETRGRNATGRAFTLEDTWGCSCEQILDTCGYGQGHAKLGCSHSVMDWWTGLYDREGEAPLQCKAD